MMTKHVRILVPALLLSGLAGAVLAATTTNSPGSACVATAGSVNVRGDGEAENVTGSTITVVCPADRPIGGSPATKVSGTVFVIDQNPAGEVCCKVMSKNPSGAVVQSASVCSTGSSSSYQNLALPEITDTFTFSHFFIQCTIPPASAGLTSRISTYRTAQQ